MSAISLSASWKKSTLSFCLKVREEQLTVYLIYCTLSCLWIFNRQSHQGLVSLSVHFSVCPEVAWLSLLESVALFVLYSPQGLDGSLLPKHLQGCKTNSVSLVSEVLTYWPYISTLKGIGCCFSLSRPSKYFPFLLVLPIPPRCCLVLSLLVFFSIVANSWAHRTIS